MGPLLERDAELASLRTLLVAARTGRGRLAFVAGEAGVGKTTLVNEFTDTISGEVRVIVGRCDALATPRALGPWLDIATGLGLTGEHDRDALLGNLVAHIRQHEATVVVIEDVHWADDASIDLLVMLGRRVGDLPVVVIVTYRDDEVASEHPMRTAIGDLITASCTVWIGVSALTPDAVQTLADRVGVRGEGLYERTGGNPFFVTEALASAGDEIPPSIRLAVLARAARLDPSARSVLDAVSIVPGRAEAWLVSALCEDHESAVDACVDAGVLTHGQNAYMFRHELARLAIEADLPAGVRRRLNQRAIVALESRGDVDPARVAHHAEAAGDDEVLARSARQAFLSAAGRTAHREAARHGERALSLPEFLSTDDVADLRMKLAASLIALARSGEAEVLASDAADYWRQAGDDRREAEALVVLSSAMASLGHTAKSMVPLGRAVEILERHDPGPALASAYVRLATAYMLARQRDLAENWGERAIALAGRLGAPSLLGPALIVTGIADVMDARFEGLTRVQDGIELGLRHDLPGVVAQGLRQIGSGCGEMRRYDDAVPALIRGSEFAAQHSLETDRRYQVAWLARCRFDLGQWDEVEALAQEAIAGLRTDAAARFVGLNTLGWLRARRGAADVFSLLDEACLFARETGHVQRLWPNAVARAEAGWLDGELEPHIPMLEEALELAQQARHGLAIGEVGLWLHRAGRISAPPADAANPFAAWIAADHMQASAQFRQMGCPYETASVLAETGELPSLREALATFRRLGAAPMAGRVSELLRARGERVSSSPTVKPSTSTRHPSGLSDREIQVLKLVTAGFSNPQIAKFLYISRKTAEHHVSNILMKLGTTTRSEAAAAAVRLGMAG